MSSAQRLVLIGCVRDGAEAIGLLPKILLSLQRDTFARIWWWSSLLPHPTVRNFEMVCLSHEDERICRNVISRLSSQSSCSVFNFISILKVEKMNLCILLLTEINIDNSIVRPTTVTLAAFAAFTDISMDVRAL